MTLKALKSGMKKFTSGFSLMELLIAIAIIAILAAVAVPTYIHYTRKGYYADIVKQAQSLKTSVEACIQANSGTKTGCDGGTNNIPPNVASGTGQGQVHSITVKNGVIKVIPRATNGISATDTYILTPKYSEKSITWTVSGGGCTSGFVSCP